MAVGFKKPDTFLNRLNRLMNGEYIERLSGFEGKTKLAQNDLAQIMGVTRQAISKWTTAESNPSSENIIKLASAYNISSDWILGLTDVAFYEDNQSFKPFQNFGFSIEAYNALLALKEQNPERLDCYATVLNILLSKVSTESCIVDGGTNVTSKPRNILLQELYNYLNPKYASSCWITVTSPEDLADIMWNKIGEDYHPERIVKSLSGFHAIHEKLEECSPEMYEAYSMSKITQELQFIKEALKHNDL